MYNRNKCAWDIVSYLLPRFLSSLSPMLSAPPSPRPGNLELLLTLHLVAQDLCISGYLWCRWWSFLWRALWREIFRGRQDSFPFLGVHFSFPWIRPPQNYRNTSSHIEGMEKLKQIKCELKNLKLWARCCISHRQKEEYQRIKTLRREYVCRCAACPNLFPFALGLLSFQKVISSMKILIDLWETSCLLVVRATPAFTPILWFIPSILSYSV